MYYITLGACCSWCGHHHKTQQAAEHCLADNQEGCHQQSGYSDRKVYCCDDDGAFLCLECGEQIAPSSSLPPPRQICHECFVSALPDWWEEAPLVMGEDEDEIAELYALYEHEWQW